MKRFNAEHHTWRDSVGTIYVLKHASMPFVKIGFTRFLDKRLAAIRQEFGPVVCLVTRRDSIASEKAIHEQLNAYRIAGEWFLFVGECRDLVENFRSTHQ